MEIKAKRGKISAYQLFVILVISRGVVAITFFQSVLNGGVTADSLLSLVFACLFTLLLSVPAYLCVVKYKNPLSSKWASIIYLIYYMFFSAVNISRFAFFASSRISQNSTDIMFIVFFTLAVCYAASLGIESLARASSICGVVSVLVLLAVALLNIKNFEFLNLFPFFINSKNSILENSLVFASNSIEPVMFLSLSRVTNAKKAKPLFLSVIIVYAAIIILILFCVGVLGRGTSLYAYPIFTLFQMTSFKNFSRLDMIHTAFGVFALFLKCSVLIFCASSSFKKFNYTKKCFAISAIVGIVAVFINKLFSTQIVVNSRFIYIWISIIFCIVIPVLFLLFAKKEKGEEIIEKF